MQMLHKSTDARLVRVRLDPVRAGYYMEYIPAENRKTKKKLYTHSQRAPAKQTTMIMSTALASRTHTVCRTQVDVNYLPHFSKRGAKQKMRMKQTTLKRMCILVCRGFGF